MKFDKCRAWRKINAVLHFLLFHLLIANGIFFILMDDKDRATGPLFICTKFSHSFRVLLIRSRIKNHWRWFYVYRIFLCHSFPFFSNFRRRAMLTLTIQLKRSVTAFSFFCGYEIWLYFANEFMYRRWRSQVQISQLK